MKFNTLKRMMMVAAFGLIAILGTSEIANAQYNRDYREWQKQQRKIARQQQKNARQQQRYERMRYRIYQNGNYYNTDERGVQLLRQAVNSGYQQGFRVGQYDRSRGNVFGYNS